MVWRLGLLVLLAAGAVAWILTLPAIAQDPAYHQFVDQRAIAGIPNFWNVVSNLPFLFVGLYGLYACGQARWLELSHRYPWTVAAMAAIFIAFGSGYYHWHPDNRTLFWDRLPMTLAFMGVFGAAIAERISTRWGYVLLGPFLLLGLWSVEVWRRGELTGAGDLRFYAVVQFYPMAAIPLILLLFPTRYTKPGGWWALLGLYAAAKLFETFDAQFSPLSGHTLKHMTAALALGSAYRMVRTRVPY